MFYYDYEDYQLTYVQGTFFAAQNAPSKVTGVQGDVAVQVTDSDTFTLTATVQDAKILDRRLFPRNGIPASIYNFELPNAPDLTASAGWEHAWDLSGKGSIIGRAQAYYSSAYWMVFTHDTNTRQESYTNSSASLVYEAASDRWSAGLWVRNIEDEAFYVGANKPAPNAATAPYLLAPRTWGASFHVAF